MLLITHFDIIILIEQLIILGFKMKQYFITSLYSQNMQVAVQQNHSMARMMRDMIKPENQQSEEFRVFEEYLNFHETTICLGTGQPMDLLSLYSFMQVHKDALKIPMGIFQEPSMNFTATSLTFVTNEKLSYPIAREIRNIFKDNNIHSFYNFRDSISLTNFGKTMTIDVDFDNNAQPVFNISFVRNKFKSSQNEEMMPKDLTPEVLAEIYREQHFDDYAHHNNVNPYRKVDKETINVSYSLPELVFLDMISHYRLK